MSVPNQKKIIIERSSENCRKDFLKVSNTNLHLAMYNLSSNAFILWLYFTDNANGYPLDLYPVDFTNITQLSRSTYDRAFKELEEMGYLIKSSKQKNLYLFREESQSNKIVRIDEVLSLEKEALEDIKDKYFNQKDFENEKYLI